MAKSKTTKKIFNMAYGIGAAIVIVGALFKILHWEIDLGAFKLGGGTLLAFGLITEAIIFFISAFEPVEEDYDWATVFPELAGGQPRDLLAGGSSQNINSEKALSEEDTQVRESLSEKLDEILSEAKVDANLMKSLGRSIENFAGVAKEIAPVAKITGSVHKYGDELSLAATHLESLNSLYRLQLERTENQVAAQSNIVDNITLLNDEMLSLRENISSLNNVYGGMLTAMGGNK